MAYSLEGTMPSPSPGNGHRVVALLLLAATACWTALAAPERDRPAKPALLEAPRPRPVPPPGNAAIDKSIQRGVEFLVKNQNKDGSWGTPLLNKGGVAIYAPVPGAHQAFQSAVTALSISALIEVGGDSAPVRRALAKAEPWLIAELPKVRRATPDALYNIWSHIYGIQAFVRMSKCSAGADRQQQLAALIKEQISFLRRYESVDDGWGYYDFRVGSRRPATDSTSFMTAAALVALREGRDLGVEVPDKLIRGAVASIHRQRLPDFSYLYGEYLKWQPRMGINRPGGSLGRSQACNLALRLWQDEKITDDVMKSWLDRLFARNGWLDMGRKKPIPHESFFQVAGYFFYFGHYYAGLTIPQLPPGDRPFYQDQLATLILRLQSEDGSWWDFPLYDYHQQYGTAFALMTLGQCRRQ
jgi:hypothetical protein